MTFAKFAVFIAVTFSSRALAQLPESRVLTLEIAQKIAQETLAQCRASGYRVAVLVVDSLNAPKAMLRDDGTSPSTAEAARMKATSAMLYNRPSGPPQQPAPGTTAPPATIPGTLNSLGGVPIKFGDVTIGAVGVSGAPGGDKDAACANAALAKLADRLR